MRKTRPAATPIWLFWLPALLFTCSDAMAWGLYSHIYFAQALLWLMPVADPRFRRAAQRLPRLVMAGACLPDLAVVHHWAGDRFAATHQWQTAQRLLHNADDDAGRALALGFACHLLTDIYAHNYFVPAHELIWGHTPVLTHAACEWAMDRYVASAIPCGTSALLRRERPRVTNFVADHFACTETEAMASVRRLCRADDLLRHTGLPTAIHTIARRADRQMERRFAHYLSETTARLHMIEGLIAGDTPVWHAEVCPISARSQLRSHSPEQLRLPGTLPRNVFAAA
jgi:hypothetical protein